MELLTKTPIIFVISVGIIIFIKVTLKLNSQKENDLQKEFVQKELEANFVRKKEIDPQYFVQHSLSDLPIDLSLIEEDNPKLFKAQKKVINRNELKMIKLSKIPSNRDIKTTFGFNNFEKVIIYEEHYNLYIQALISFAEILIEQNRIKDAEKVLLQSILLGSEYLKSYRLLVDIYKISNSKLKLQQFSNKIDKNEILNDNQVLKKQITDYIIKTAKDL